MALIQHADRGSQFKSIAKISVMKDHDIRSSMDDKGCLWDNVFIERLWNTITYEETYLTTYDIVLGARNRLNKCMHLYNQRRPAQANGRVPPEYRYYKQLPQMAAA